MRPRRRPLNVLGEHLEQLKKDRGWTDVVLRHHMGLAKSTLSHLKHRPPTRVPARERVAKWAKALGLTASETEELHEKVQLAFSPEPVRKRIEALERELKALRERHVR